MLTQWETKKKQEKKPEREKIHFSPRHPGTPRIKPKERKEKKGRQSCVSKEKS